MRYISEKIEAEGIDTHTLVSQTESPVFEKYDDYVPPELLRRAYAADRLNVAEAEERILDLDTE